MKLKSYLSILLIIFASQFLGAQMSDKNTKEKTEQATKILNNIFDNNPNKTDVFVSILNTSQCPIMMNITGEKNYSVEIPSEEMGFVSVKKGKYLFESTICNAKYRSEKNIVKDTQITLTHSVKKG